MDNELGRSDLLHHFPSINTFLEGRKLIANEAMPPTGRRVMHSVIDLNQGLEIFCSHRVGNLEEPDLHALVSDDPHPLLLIHWVVIDKKGDGIHQ